MGQDSDRYHQCTDWFYCREYTYVKAKVQNNLIKICLIINGVYLAGGIAALGMMILPKIM